MENEFLLYSYFIKVYLFDSSYFLLCNICYVIKSLNESERESDAGSTCDNFVLIMFFIHFYILNTLPLQHYLQTDATTGLRSVEIWLLRRLGYVREECRAALRGERRANSCGNVK